MGGVYDLTARVIARHMGRYIPGNPTLIVQNMPGGGNVLATNYMYNIAPKDGLTIASIHNAMPLHQVLDGRGVRFDAGKFSWLGSTGSENEVILAWHTAGISTIQQAREKEIALGATGSGSGLSIIPTAMNNVLGTRFKLVIGYKTSEDINLALQRGEVQARAFGINSIESQHPDWLKEGKVAFLAQAGVKRDKDLPDVPLLTELAGTPQQRQNPQAHLRPGRPRASLPGAARHPARAARRPAPGLRRDPEGQGVPGRGREAPHRHRPDEPRGGGGDRQRDHQRRPEVVAQAKAAMEAPEARPQGGAPPAP